jgi:myo-inositol-1(or 4)-monophosphatase
VDSLSLRNDARPLLAAAVDLPIETAIKSVLATAAPELPFLGEERGGAHGGRACWVLDPIDGTITMPSGA